MKVESLKKIDMSRKFIVILFGLLLFVSCHKQPVQISSVTTEMIPVDASADAIQDTNYLAQLAPYKAHLANEMSVQIGYTPERMWVGEPECPMLNWASDALWEAAKQVYPGTVDIAIVNMGCMRCEWPAGPITRESVYELMPFDNRLVVLTLKGEDILALCESFARYGGQGVAGIRVTIIDGQVADVQVGGKALKMKATYKVATSDYLAGGTDHMEALTRYTDYWNSDLLIRNLYLESVRQHDTIRAYVDGRMTIQP